MIKCWHYRRIISRSADENTPLPPDAQVHLAQCPDCRRRHETEHEIASRLAAGAARQKLRQLPNFAHARIMARITESSHDERLVTGRFLFRRPAIVSVLVIVLAALLLWSGSPNFKPRRGQTARVQPAPESVATLELPDTKVLTQWVTHPDQPLETEMNAVVHDARNAVTALADNFFPEKLRQTLLDTPSAKN
jgi:hypothetical protein